MIGNKLGHSGEEIACEYLTNLGYKILDTNYLVFKLGELDVVAMLEDTVVIVEVKTRAERDKYSGVESVSPRKIKSIINSAYAYLKYHFDYVPPVRFDIIVTDGVEVIEHIPNAFSKNDMGFRNRW